MKPITKDKFKTNSELRTLFANHKLFLPSFSTTVQVKTTFGTVQEWSSRSLLDSVKGGFNTLNKNSSIFTTPYHQKRHDYHKPPEQDFMENQKIINIHKPLYTTLHYNMVWDIT